MAKTTVVFARVDTEVKEKAENILTQLGISPTSAIRMFYSQIFEQTRSRMFCASASCSGQSLMFGP